MNLFLFYFILFFASLKKLKKHEFHFFLQALKTSKKREFNFLQD